MRSILCTTSLIALLTGCAEKEIFGVPESSWEKLTPQQQSQVIEGHHRKKELKMQQESEKIRAAQNPLSRLIDNVTDVIKENKNNNRTHEQAGYNTPRQYRNDQGVIQNYENSPISTSSAENVDGYNSADPMTSNKDLSAWGVLKK